MLNQMLQESVIDVHPNSLFVDNVEIVAKAVKSNPGEPKDRAAMRKIQVITNGLHESMRLKIDFPSNHASSRMPVPDTQQWTEPVKCRNTAKCQIFHSRYRKLIASKHVVNKKSALSQEMKMDTLVADLLRIMRNVSPLCCEQHGTN